MRGELRQEWEGACHSWEQHDKGVPLLTPSFPSMTWDLAAASRTPPNH